MNKRFIILTSALSLAIVTPFFTFAQGALNFTTLDTTLERFKDILGTLTTVIIALSLIFFFWGLAKFILSAGEEEAKEEGKRIMFWGILAFVIMIGIWGIVNFLIGAFGISGSNPPQIPQVPR